MLPCFVPPKVHFCRVVCPPRKMMLLLSIAWEPIGKPALVFSIIYRYMASMRSCFKVGGFIGSWAPMSEKLLGFGDMNGNGWLTVPAFSLFGCLALASTLGVAFRTASFFDIVLEPCALRKFSKSSVRLTPSIALSTAFDLQRPLM